MIGRPVKPPHYSKAGRRLGKPRSSKRKPLSTKLGRKLLRQILETGDKVVLRPWGGYTLLKAQKNIHKSVTDALVRHGLLGPTEEIPYVYRASAVAARELALAEGHEYPLLDNENGG